MKQYDQHERFKKMSKLIQSGQTGTPAEFARYLGISQSHLFRTLHKLEQSGLAIKYSRTLRTYFGTNEMNS
jgi:DNA-binding MarR family transcriptional regulator